MKALRAYIDQNNSFNALFNGEQFEIKTAKGRQRVASRLECNLSPENLTCDGELSRSEVQARYRALTDAVNDLKRLDPSVKIYDFS